MRDHQKGNDEILFALKDILRQSCSSEDQWRKAAVFSGLLKSGVSASKIAKAANLSITMVLEYANTYDAFPDRGKSIAEKKLSFTHYRYAARTDDPARWIRKTVRENLTSRQLAFEILKEQKQVAGRKSSNREKAFQYRLILDAVAQQLGMDDWDGEPTAWFANELFYRLLRLTRHNEVSAKVNAIFFKKMSAAVV